MEKKILNNQVHRKIQLVEVIQFRSSATPVLAQRAREWSAVVAEMEVCMCLIADAPSFQG